MTAPAAHMPTALSEHDVYRLCGPTVFLRAKSYYRAGHVLRPCVEGNILRAEVAGNDPEPYEVSVTMAPDHLACQCTCQYGAEYCKHVGALLLAWAFAPQTFGISASQAVSHAQSGPSPSGHSRAAFDPVFEVAMPDDVQPDLPPLEELRTLLEPRSLVELRQIARRRVIPLHGAAKADVAAQLASGLLDPVNLSRAVAALSASELVIVDLVHLLARGEFVRVGRVVEALASLDIGLPNEANILLLDLRDRGLLAGGPRGTYQEDAYRVPAGVIPYLPPVDYLVRRLGTDLTPAPVAPTQLPVDELLYLIWRHFRQHVVHRRPPVERTLLEKTSDLLRGWHNDPDEVAQLLDRSERQRQAGTPATALPAPPELADADLAVVATLAGGDRELVEFGFHILRQLRLVTGKDRFLAQEPALRQFLRQVPPLRRRAVAIAWLKTTEWSELTLLLLHDPRLRLRRVLNPYAVLKPKEFFEVLAYSRRLLVRFLLRLEEGVWYSIPSLLESLRRLAWDNLGDRSLVDASSLPRWWLELGPARRLDLRVPEDWAVGFGQTFVEALRGPLTWLGIAAVAEVEGELAFRVEGLRALLAGEANAAEDVQPLRVAADLTVTVPAGCGDLSTHDFLLSVAEPGEATPRGMRYRFTPAQACAAFAAGHDAKEIIAFLEARAAPAALPDTVRTTLEDWAQRYGCLRLYTNLALVEFADDYTLPELLATTGLPRQLVYQFSPRLIAVDAAGVDDLLDELVRKGYTPKLAEGEP